MGKILKSNTTRSRSRIRSRNNKPKTPKKNKKSSSSTYQYFTSHLGYLNDSKFFAGCIMILLNIGSKFITINFSKSTEEYLKMLITKELLVFAMAWMGTRDIFTAICLTAAFTVLSDFLFNEDSGVCIVPHHLRVLNKNMDLNNDGKISPDELNKAISVLEKAKKNYQQNKEYVETMSLNTQTAQSAPLSS